jgi:antitoxin ParD1/3/4
MDTRRRPARIRQHFAIVVVMRTKLNISLPPGLKQWVEEQIDQGGYGNANEYIHQLIREERKRQARLRIEAKLQEAIDSGEPEAVTAATWSESEKRFRIVSGLELQRDAGQMARLSELRDLLPPAR